VYFRSFPPIVANVRKGQDFGAVTLGIAFGVPFATIRTISHRFESVLPPHLPPQNVTPIVGGPIGPRGQQGPLGRAWGTNRRGWQGCNRPGQVRNFKMGVRVRRQLRVVMPGQLLGLGQAGTRLAKVADETMTVGVKVRE
jgi:hypothetical protein